MKSITPVLFCLLVTVPAASAQTKSAVVAATADISSVLEATAGRVAPAVVEIFTTTYSPTAGVVPRTADLVTTQRASGSGVIVDPNGFIITNAHVVRGARHLHVELPMESEGRSILAIRSRIVAGTVVGMDVETDLAVVKIEETGLPAIGFGDSDALKAGQLVLAFGSPLGLRNSVSLGVVSAIARQLEADSPMIYVQTDASINPGSSGGPLVDLRGHLVGINTLIASRSGGSEGVGFAAPSNIVRTVYEQIKAQGYVRRGDIGVRAQTLTPVLASGLGLAGRRGVVLADVLPGSPADRAGLRHGDLVLTLDGKPIENGRQLQVNLYRRFVGDLVTLEVARDGQTITAYVAVSERHHPFAGTTIPDTRENMVPRLGILGMTLDPRLAQLVPVLRVSQGVVVASTVPDAFDARDGGLAPGDVIYAVNRVAVEDLAQLRRIVDAMSPGAAVVLQIERRGELMYIAFTLD